MTKIESEPLNTSDKSMEIVECDVRDTTTSFVEKISNFFKNIYYFLIFKKSGKFILTFLFIAYLSFSIWNLTSVEESFNMEDLVSNKSYFKNYIKDMKSQELAPIVMIVVNKTLVYNKSIQKKIDEILYEFKQTGLIRNELPFKWSQFLDSLLKPNLTKENIESAKNQFLPFKNDVVIEYNSEQNSYEVAASRYYLQFNKLNFDANDAKQVERLHEMAHSFDIPLIIYSIPFKNLELLGQMSINLIQTFVLTIESVYLFSFLPFLNLLSAICITLSVSSIFAGFIGIMVAFGTSLNILTITYFIISLNISICFCVHVVNSYIMNTSEDSKEKCLKLTLKKTCLPLFYVQIILILSSCTLSFAQSFVFSTLFKTLFFTNILCLIHTTFFIPVLLSVIGPYWSKDTTRL